MPKLRLAAIGDSLLQGFQSAAIERSKLAWSTPAILARALGLDVPRDFRPAIIPGPGIPLNLEDLLLKSEQKLGKELSLVEWVSRFPLLLSNYLDSVESYYERGDGALAMKNYRHLFHNLSIWGYTVHEATALTLERCREIIDEEEGFIEDDLLGIPSAAMYRTALRVLNPAAEKKRKRETQVSTFARLVKEEGVDVLLLSLGANDCLGTVLTLEIRDMEDAECDIPSDPYERLRWNLTSERQFARDYADLADGICEAIEGHGTKVFVSNIPHVTIPPITTGVGHFDGTYFDLYARFFVNDQNRGHFPEHLTREDARKIDARIDAFNQVIASTAAARGFHLVDLCGLLDKLAVKRQHLEDHPDQPLRAHLPADHPLLQESPVPSVLQLRLDEHGKRRQGGLFSLDGVHPSTIGYGLIAEHYLEVMREVIPEARDARVPWAEVIANDSLLRSPPALWEQVVTAAESHPALWGLVFRALA